MNRFEIPEEYHKRMESVHDLVRPFGSKLVEWTVVPRLPERVEWAIALNVSLPDYACKEGVVLDLALSIFDILKSFVIEDEVGIQLSFLREDENRYTRLYRFGVRDEKALESALGLQTLPRTGESLPPGLHAFPDKVFEATF